MLRAEARRHAPQQFSSPERSVRRGRRVIVRIVEDHPGNPPAQSVAATRIAQQYVQLAVGARRAAQRAGQAHDLWPRRGIDPAAGSPLLECRSAILELC
jgi:hypothetical protein